MDETFSCTRCKQARRSDQKGFLSICKDCWKETEARKEHGEYYCIHCGRFVHAEELASVYLRRCKRCWLEIEPLRLKYVTRTVKEGRVRIEGVYLRNPKIGNSILLDETKLVFAYFLPNFYAYMLGTERAIRALRKGTSEVEREIAFEQEYRRFGSERALEYEAWLPVEK